ncbi:AraC family transcriptional regulator [Neolewinella aurantiaca]|uniref:AraC family transcriptional regulator n=1 Tax=Neolewinella aurantiaca TaxID=2602767 RepID=A0A5C7FHQ3_9BACT|nr:helix-turn-helix domain-containing protein [Neolewinella aurantiaca]TXF90008.1 AraC family transcriptional regulator [Neolewinella aurantiaca]
MLLYVRGITLLNTILSVGVFLGVSLTIFLLFRQSYKSYANIFLALVVCCCTMCILPGYLYGARLLQYIPQFSNVGIILFPVLGPLIYLYTKASTQRSFRLEARDLFHLVPFLLFFLLDWKLLVSSDVKVFTDHIRMLEEGIYPIPVWERALKMLITLAYFLLSVRRVFRYQQHLSDTSVHIDRSYAQWLLLFSSVLLMPLVAIGLVVFTQYRLVSATLLAVSFVSFILMVYLAALLKPALFHKFPNRIEKESAAEVARKKYESSNLRSDQKKAMAQKVLSFVVNEKPYLEPELTLGQLAGKVGIPSHYLSQVINEEIEQSFGDFINGYRVERAKAMLADDDFSHFTIIAMAYEAGFNSKTAFYEAFRKFTGTTPGKYRKSL